MTQFIVYTARLTILDVLGFRHANIFHDLNSLAIRKLKIPARDVNGRLELSLEEPSLPDTLRRAGTFLLSMLRVQYNDIRQLIAGLTRTEANIICKEQLVKYQKGVYSFDRPFRDKDTART